MPFDRLDKKIREASGQYQDSYDEQAWSKMEKLLDKHLPNSKERKRISLLLWLSFLLVIISGVFVMLSIPWGNADVSALLTQKIIHTPSLKNIEVPFLKRSGNNSTSKHRDFTSKIDADSETSISENNTKKTYFKRILTPGKTEQYLNNNFSNNVNDQLAFDNGFEKNKDVFITNKQKGEENLTNKKLSEGEKQIIASSSEQKLENTSQQKITSSAKKNMFKSYLALSLSAGPDVSAADINDIGKINTMFGAGIIYQFREKWNIRTGFYVVKKIYEAKPSGYHPPEAFRNANPDLADIDANCSIYEIPIILNYALSGNEKYRWFTSAGFSSYLMKKEIYDYSTKSATGQSQYKRIVINDQYRHFLSSLRLSLGYERRINNNFFIATEPYVNLPLSGIGFGKGKIKSAGILFTLGIKAFGKK